MDKEPIPMLYFDDPASFGEGNQYKRISRFPLLVSYKGEESFTIVNEPNELLNGIVFTVIETQCL